jgi:hypothetical protein
VSNEPESVDDTAREAQITFVQSALRANAEWGRIADPKLFGVMLFLGLGLSNLLGGARALWDAHQRPTALGWFATAFFVVALIAAGIAVGWTAVGLYPRIERDSDDGPSLYFFGGIAQHKTVERYREEMRSRTPRDLERDLEHQTWEMARVALRKHQCVRRAYQAAGLFLVAWASARAALFFAS